VSKAAAKTKARKESEGVDIRGVYYRTSTWKKYIHLTIREYLDLV